MTADFDALEDFAGPGGWDQGARMLGLRLFGVDYDGPACATATAAGHHRVQADVTEHQTPAWARGRGHVSSPSCTLFSAAGTGIGRRVLDALAEGIRRIFAGAAPAAVRVDVQARIYPVAHAEAVAKNQRRKPEKRWTEEKVEAKARLDAKVAALVLEPARRIMEIAPEWVALEQVPEVLPLWQVYEQELRARGWSCFAVIVNAADFGVPQTRRRAILGGSRIRRVTPPAPTHAEHPQDDDLFGHALQKWVSMADALGWDPEVTMLSNYNTGGQNGVRGERTGDQPAATGTTKIDRAKLVVDRRQMSKGARGSKVPVAEVPVTRPAPTVTSQSGDQWVIRPAWVHQRPATTIVGSFKPEVVAAPGYRTQESRQNAPGSVTVSVAEAGVLQSFPVDYPWQGSKSKQYEQVGNAIPPLLAAHILAAVTGRSL